MEDKKQEQKQEFKPLTAKEVKMLSEYLNNGLERAMSLVDINHSLACGFCLGFLGQIDSILKSEIEVPPPVTENNRIETTS